MSKNKMKGMFKKAAEVKEDVKPIEETKAETVKPAVEAKPVVAKVKVVDAPVIKKVVKKVVEQELVAAENKKVKRYIKQSGGKIVGIIYEDGTEESV